MTFAVSTDNELHYMSKLQNQKQNKWAEKRIYNQQTIRWAFWI